MFACLDMGYRQGEATAAAVVFRDWTGVVPCSQYVPRVSPIEPYVPGAFYRRELPCLLAVLDKIRQPLYVTTARKEAVEAARHIAVMHGRHRIPTLLALADQLTRQHIPASQVPHAVRDLKVRSISKNR